MTKEYDFSKARKNRDARVRTASPAAPTKQLAGFIAKFDPKVGKLVRAAGAALRKRWPTAVELVYDNYNALAIGWAPNERTSEAFVSLAVFPRGLNLYFVYGASLPDPHGLLKGSGSGAASSDSRAWPNSASPGSRCSFARRYVTGRRLSPRWDEGAW